MRAWRVLVVVGVLGGMLAVAPAGGAVVVYEEFVPVQVSGGYQHTCVVAEGGVVKCWGRNDEGELGLGDTRYRGDNPGEMGDMLPLVDLGVGAVVSVSAGPYHSCALLESGVVKCWGHNGFGELGLGDTQDRGDQPGEMGANLPVVDLGESAVGVATGYGFSCALLSSGGVKCWGWNAAGQLGLGDTQNRGDQPGEMGTNLPVVDLGEAAIAISGGNDEAGWAGHTCALLSSGVVKCWGHNNYGELGLGDTQNRGDDPGEMGAALAPVELGDTVTEIGAGTDRNCALLSSGAVKCWGGNYAGQLGLGDTQNRGDNPGEMGTNLPAVDLGEPATAISVGQHACALLASGSLKCWGINYAGQLGLGDTQNRGDNPGEMGASLPAVDLAERAVAVAGRASHKCAILESGAVKCWGYNTGRLGLGDTNHRGDEPGEMGAALPAVDLGWVWSGVSVPVGTVTVTVATAGGLPLVGGSVSWVLWDGTAGSSQPKVTDGAGQVRFGMVSGPVVFTVSGGTSPWPGVVFGGAEARVFVDGGPLAVTLPDPPARPEPVSVTRRVEVVLPDGGPVAEATVSMPAPPLSTAFPGWVASGHLVSAHGEYDWTGVGSLGWQSGVRQTDFFGVVEDRFVGFGDPGSPLGKKVTVTFDDGEVWQTKQGVFDASGLAQVMLTYMPYVVLESPADVTVPEGGEVEVLVQAVDNAGVPIAGAGVGLEGTVTGADQVLAGARTGCVPKLTGTTNLNGWVRLRLCAVSSGVWHADGTSLVPSAPVRVTVPSCGGRLATKVGTSGPDTLEGTAGADVIHGLGGNDTIYGFGGDDLICGGAGNDFIYGGSGNDRIWGQGGHDRLFGQGGNDGLFGGPGVDRAVGGLGTDRCVAETTFCEM